MKRKKKKTSFKQILKRLKIYIYYSTRMAAMAYRANSPIFLLLSFSIILVSLIPIAEAYLFKIIIDLLVEQIKSTQVQISSFADIIAIYLLLSFSNRLFWRLIDYGDRIIYLDLGRLLTLAVNRRLANLDFAYWENPKFNNLLNKVKETYTWRPVNFANRQIWFFNNLVQVVSNIIVLITLSPFIVLLTFFSTIPEFIIGIKFSRNVWNIHGAKGDLRRDFWNTSHYLGDDNYLKEIRIFSIQKYLLGRINNLYTRFFNYQKIEIKKAFFANLGSGLIAFLATAAASIFVVSRAFLGQISIGSLNFYLGRISATYESLKGLFHNLSQNFEDLLYVEDTFKVLNLPVLVNPNPKGKKVHSPFTIEFKNITFSYPNSPKQVLKNFNLTIKDGEKIALIGENGAGKTTLVKLLCRFYDLDLGQILINGVDLRELNLPHWYQQMGALFQDFNRYAYTVKENINLGAIDRPFEKKLFFSSLRKSGSHSFVGDLPQAEETILSKQFKKGTDLSTGQWQKIALSRAFFRDAPILILDEPTSAIDAKAEHEIFKKIHDFEKGKTVIMISHRFSTVRNADKIYIIKNGQITESGTHLKLIKKNGDYAKLFNLQAAGYQV